jgi:hypothetical protein
LKQSTPGEDEFHHWECAGLCEQASSTQDILANQKEAAPLLIDHRGLAGDEAERRRTVVLVAGMLQSIRERENGSGRTVGSPGALWRRRRGWGRSETMESMAASVRNCELVGIDWGRAGPIPSAGKLQTARRSSRASRGVSGRPPATGLGGGRS